MHKMYFLGTESRSFRKFVIFSQTRTFSWHCLKDSSVGLYENGDVSEPITIPKLFEDPFLYYTQFCLGRLRGSVYIHFQPK